MTIIVPKLKHRQYKQVKRAPKSGNGHSGNGPKPARYIKKHLRANGAPGTPQGVCVRSDTRQLDCRCGKHNA